MSGEGQRLILQHEGGYRHYLLGRAVHAGTRLELLTDNGWVTGRYEWRFHPDIKPYLVLNTETGETVVLEYDAELRWPEK